MLCLFLLSVIIAPLAVVDATRSSIYHTIKFNSILKGKKLINGQLTANYIIPHLPRGGAAAALNPFPAGYNPLGYAVTDLGKTYLEFEGSLDSDVGRFLSTLKSKRKSKTALKEQWLEIVRVSKKAQSMRIYRKLDDMIEFCLSAGFID